MVLLSRGTRPFVQLRGYCPWEGLGKCEDMGCIHVPSLPTCLESADTSQTAAPLAFRNTVLFCTQSESVQSCTSSVSSLNFLDGV